MDQAVLHKTKGISFMEELRWAAPTRWDEMGEIANVWEKNTAEKINAERA